MLEVGNLASYEEDRSHYSMVTVQQLSSLCLSPAFPRCCLLVCSAFRPLTRPVASRSQWAIVSSPLTLGMDVRNATKVDAVMPILSNMEVLAVNQHVSSLPKDALFAAIRRISFQCCQCSASSQRGGLATTVGRQLRLPCRDFQRHREHHIRRGGAVQCQQSVAAALGSACSATARGCRGIVGDADRLGSGHRR